MYAKAWYYHLRENSYCRGCHVLQHLSLHNDTPPLEQSDICFVSQEPVTEVEHIQAKFKPVIVRNMTVTNTIQYRYDSDSGTVYKCLDLLTYLLHSL